MTLTLALSYGAQADMVDAIKTISTKVKEGKLDVGEINKDLISQHLSTHYAPDPEL